MLSSAIFVGNGCVAHVEPVPRLSQSRSQPIYHIWTHFSRILMVIVLLEKANSHLECEKSLRIRMSLKLISSRLKWNEWRNETIDPLCCTGTCSRAGAHFGMPSRSAIKTDHRIDSALWSAWHTNILLLSFIWGYLKRHQTWKIVYSDATRGASTFEEKFSSGKEMIRAWRKQNSMKISSESVLETAFPFAITPSNPLFIQTEFLSSNQCLIKKN